MFKNGGPHGERVLLYDENAQIAFDGKMNCGIREGYGKSYWPNGQVMFEGIFVNDGPDDDGDSVTIHFPNGKILYKGRMEAGMRNGHGTTYFKNGVMEYEGQWLKNMPDGQNVII